MKVGIDLSSTNTGLVILSDDNKLIFHGNFQLWDKSSQKPNRVFVRELFDIINCKRLNETNITIGVELSDFGNWKYADRFNFIAGALYQEHYCQDWGMMGDFICFNSNEWQSIIWDKNQLLIESRTITNNGKKKQQFRIKSGNGWAYQSVKWTIEHWSEWLDKRGMLKLLSRMWAHTSCVEYRPEWTEDECDAYCIAYFLKKLRDRTQMHQEVKEKKVQAKKSKLAEKNEKIRKLKKSAKLSEIIAKYDKRIASGKKLTKSQINAQERAIKELKELKNE